MTNKTSSQKRRFKIITKDQYLPANIEFDEVHNPKASVNKVCPPNIFPQQTDTLFKCTLTAVLLTYPSEGPKLGCQNIDGTLDNINIKQSLIVSIISMLKARFSIVILIGIY